jgi:hypothetical protein
MDIFFDGRQDGNDALQQLLSVFQLFKERYQITQFREIHLSVTLVDEEGEDVELVDTETAQVYRTFEVYGDSRELHARKPHNRIRLVVDNTHRTNKN